MKTNDQMLIDMAIAARERAYAPYSDFCVGAALLCLDGSVYDGCNIENASFTPTCCAERVAIYKAVSDGKRKFDAIAIVGGRRGAPNKYCYPCGVCRQVLSEFCDAKLRVILFDGQSKLETTLGELLPRSFNFDASEKV